MKQRMILILGVSILIATGCGTKPAVSPVAPTPLPSLTGNWQIQSVPPSTQTPAAGVVLFGALQNTGAQVIGTFRFSNLAQAASGCALNQVITVTGTLDASGNLALTSAALADGTIVTVQLVLAPLLTSFATGTIAVSGKTCAFAQGSAIADRIAPTTGTYTGALTPIPTLSTAGPAGSATLTLTQSAAPDVVGQFPVTGSLAYAFGTCAGNITLTGTASGVLLTLTSITPSPQLLPNVHLLGGLAPTGNPITLVELLFTQFPCTVNQPVVVSYTGTLTKQ